MKIVKRIFICLFLAIFIPMTCVFYAFKIEPYMLKVEKIDLSETAQNPQDKEQINIVQITDIHIKSDFTYKNLQKVVEKINAQKPDIVVFTGDLYDAYHSYNDDENIIDQLSKIQAKYAKIAIWGNRDYGGGASRVYADIMQKSGFNLLVNQNEYITLPNQKTILITGLDDSLMGVPFVPNDTNFSIADYSLLLNHEPDASENYIAYQYDIILAGHSHGGQFNIPFLPYINRIATKMTSLSTKYNKGMYSIGEEQTQKLYVNTGVGTTHISARFGVVPQIALFTIFV